MKTQLANASVAVLFSVLIWCAVGVQLDEQKTVEIEFEVKVPDNVTVSHEGRMAVGSLTVPVEVEVRGPRELLDKLSSSDLFGQRDLRQDKDLLALWISRGQHDLEIRSQDVVSTARGIEVLKVPKPISLGFGRVVYRDVELQPNVIGSPAPGFTLGRVTVNPNVVRVRGPETVFEDYAAPYRTDRIDITGKRTSFRVRVGVQCPEGVTTGNEVEVHVQVDPIPIVRNLRFRVHLVRFTRSGERELSAYNYRIEPQDPPTWEVELPLRGSQEALDALEQRLLRPGVGQLGRDLPLAYIRANELPTEDGADALADVEVLNLPDGVSYDAIQKMLLRIHRAP